MHKIIPNWTDYWDENIHATNVLREFFISEQAWALKGLYKSEEPLKSSSTWLKLLRLFFLVGGPTLQELGGVLA
jgi:hypothetical protein